jgi:hypothetical protein
MIYEFYGTYVMHRMPLVGISFLALLAPIAAELGPPHPDLFNFIPVGCQNFCSIHKDQSKICFHHMGNQNGGRHSSHSLYIGPVEICVDSFSFCR